MKKYMLLGLLLLCIVILGCDNTTDIKKDEQCKSLLNSVIENHHSDYEDFDIFYSKKYNTCITTYKSYYDSGYYQDYYYVIEDVMNTANSCDLTWEKYYVGKGTVFCRGEFSKLANRKWPYTKETDKFGDVLDWYNKILDKLK